MAYRSLRRPGDDTVVTLNDADSSLVPTSSDSAGIFCDNANNYAPSVVTTSATARIINLLFGVFGDGSDGALAYDGTTTILGMAPSSNVYTLTRDIYASSITLSGTAVIKTAGFRVFCTGLTTVPSTCRIHNDGNAAVTTTAGAITSTAGTLGAGTAGGAGGAGNNAGSAGTNLTNGFPGGTGLGGAGGTDGTHAGAAAGTWTVATAVMGGGRHLPSLITGHLHGSGTTNTVALTTMFMGGSGGGGAGCDNAATSGGAGGGGGGVLVLATQKLSLGGTITCTGGAGSAGISAANNAGGGGGGGGGVCIVLYGSKVGAGTITAAGGAGGAKAGASGVAGSAGAAGTVISLQV